MDSHHIAKYLYTHDIDLITALVIAIIGVIFARYCKRALLKLLSRRAGDHTIKLFLINLTHILMLSIITIMVLNKLGVSTTSLVAVLGASSLAIALSLKDSLANVAAGVIIILQKPFKVGNSITIGDTIGTVTLIGLYNTSIVTSNNDYISYPNNKLITDKVINHTKHSTRRLSLPLYISYKDDLEQAKNLLLEKISTLDCVLKQPETCIIVASLDTAGVLVNVNAWVKTPDYTEASSQLLQLIKSTFDQNKLTFTTCNLSS